MLDGDETILFNQNQTVDDEWIYKFINNMYIYNNNLKKWKNFRFKQRQKLIRKNVCSSLFFKL